MKPVSFFPSMLRYARTKGWNFLGFGVSLAILFIVYSLYGLPYGPVIYTAILMTAVQVLIWAGKALRHWLKLKKLEKLMECANASAGVLPMVDGLIDENQRLDTLDICYLSIIRLLEVQRTEAVSRAEQKSAAAKNYYTLWSHQAKTPLAALRLLLKEEELDRSALEQELFKAEQYVDMVLQFERLDGRDLEFVRVPVKKMVNQTAKRMAPLFIHKRIGLSLEGLEASEAEVLTDEKWFCFVLEQVLTNAVKYTRQGTVSVIWEDGRLYVKDTGLGIRPEDVPRLFECGFTGYNGRLEQGRRSTGIGLYLCKSTMDMLGHRISIKSAVGKGTTVVFDLRRRQIDRRLRRIGGFYAGKPFIPNFILSHGAGHGDRQGTGGTS